LRTVSPLSPAQTRLRGRDGERASAKAGASMALSLSLPRKRGRGRCGARLRNSLLRSLKCVHALALARGQAEAARSLRLFCLAVSVDLERAAACADILAVA